MKLTFSRQWVTRLRRKKLESGVAFVASARPPDGIPNATLPCPYTRGFASPHVSDVANSPDPTDSDRERIPASLPSGLAWRLPQPRIPGQHPTDGWESRPKSPTISVPFVPTSASGRPHFPDSSAISAAPRCTVFPP